MFQYRGTKAGYTRKRYPAPKHGRIIEPFCGSAGYSLNYHWLDVQLYDASEAVCGVWDYLINVSEAELLALPVGAHGARVDSLDICQEARWLIGFWSAFSPSTPETFMRIAPQDVSQRKAQLWGAHIRQRIADNLHKIRHWKISQCRYETIADNPEATWFIDPPYRGLKYYRNAAASIDYTHLATWCRERSGQVIVCEGPGGDWLPFEPCGEAKNKGQNGMAEQKLNREFSWVKP